MNQAAGKLTISNGPNSGQIFQLEKIETILGRDEKADFVLSDPAVSRRHTRITWRENRYWIEDLGSSNGTFLNGVRLVAEAAALAHKDQVQLGRMINLVFESTTDVEESQTGEKTTAVAVQTMIDVEKPHIPTKAPELIVTISGTPEQRYKLEEDKISIGRADDNDIVIQSQIVSRHHAHLERFGSRYLIVPHPDATNPLYLDGYPLTEKQALSESNILRIGGQDPGLMVSLGYSSPSDVESTIDARVVKFGQQNVLNIGRDAANEIVLEAPNISRYHAQIERVGQRYRVRDLRSANGTFVNDQRVDEEAWLNPNDSIKIGSYRFILGADQLSQYDDSGGLQVSAVGLQKWVRKDLNILQNISLIFQPREFIVVVGQSGGGKTTLIDSISGYRPATNGQVHVNGIDTYENFDAIRGDIGYVPQKDIIHMELTVIQALDYAARLRMPKDTSKEERDQRVVEVLDDLDLTYRKDVQISGLSGGQQKRVSIGVELLTKPGLFFLDEPTSGLDPGNETALMQLMRRLADQGRTIVLVTHATKNVMLADKVIFLARGGYLAWFGPPNEALAYFNRYRTERSQRAGKIEFDEIYAILDDPGLGSAEDWAHRFQEHRAAAEYIREPLAEAQQKAASPPIKKASKKGSSSSSRKNISSLHQFLILSARNLNILVRDRSSMILMLIVAPMVASLDFIMAPMMGRNLFDYFDGKMPVISVTLFLMTINSLLVGGLSQMREFVKEADIYKRERLVNLKIFPYVASKVWIAGLLALYQGMAYTVIHNIAFEMPGGIEEFVFTYITLVLAVLAGMMLGLMASALSPAASSAPLIMIMLLIPQIVLSGSLAPLPETVSAPASTRWTFQALMGITGGGSDVAADPCWELSVDEREALTLDEKDDLGCRCMGTNIFNPDLCNFPGIGIFYDPSVVSDEPVKPEPLGSPPPEPEIPAAPEAPEDPSDNIAFAGYMVSLQKYQEEVNRIQENYKTEIKNYQTLADAYKVEATAFQTKVTQWGIDRMSAVNGAEGLIAVMHNDFGWTFINKEDTGGYYKQVLITWISQCILIVIMGGITLFLIKRKDTK
ncbi:MAG: FHA domain-containing protein [Chloroflexota bacterium]